MPSTIPVLIVCADDYAISPQTSAVIRELAERGKLTAVSCLVDGDSWRREAELLSEVASRCAIGVGLHLNLTECMNVHEDVGVVRPIGMQILRDFTIGLPAASVRATIACQWSRFETAFGRPPAFVDGHQHVHLLPTVRRALLAVAVERGFSGWVRGGATPHGRPMLKRRFLRWLDRRGEADCRAAGIGHLATIAGIRSFSTDESLVELWRQDLLPSVTTVLIVHPGQRSPLARTDPLAGEREREAATLATLDLAALASDAGLTLAAAP